MISHFKSIIIDFSSRGMNEDFYNTLNILNVSPHVLKIDGRDGMLYFAQFMPKWWNFQQHKKKNCNKEKLQQRTWWEPSYLPLKPPYSFRESTSLSRYRESIFEFSEGNFPYEPDMSKLSTDHKGKHSLTAALTWKKNCLPTAGYTCEAVKCKKQPTSLP